jgi:hypothetical protein
MRVITFMHDQHTAARMDELGKETLSSNIYKCMHVYEKTLTAAN